MATGAPLFPGESDIDQLFHIMRCFGSLPERLMQVFRSNPLFMGLKLPESVPATETLAKSADTQIDEEEDSCEHNCTCCRCEEKDDPFGEEEDKQASRLQSRMKPTSKSKIIPALLVRGGKNRICTNSI